MIRDILLKRFINYVKIDTQSDENSSSTPSSNKQKEFAKHLLKDLKEIGVFNATMDDNGYVMAGIPSNSGKQLPTIGFIAHMDTSPEMSGENVNPKIIPDYNGDKILLNKNENIWLDPEEFPELKNYKGQTLITTDGNTLLGADDKAGIAEIITAMQYILKHPEIKHGEIKIAFTPDEEIGRGADHFDVIKFGADFAYTLDGGEIGELEYENFNAALATIKIEGRNVHPGTAKNKMLNSQYIAMEFNSLLPKSEKPEYTEGYEGFFHLIDMQGTTEESTLRYIIRDHDKPKFEERKRYINKISRELRNKYKFAQIETKTIDQYYNMKEKIEPVFHIVEHAKTSMENIGVKPIIKAIRGGTDGSRLSYMGLPCPNLFTGGHNYHGKYEFIPLESMEKAIQLVVEIAEVRK